MVQATKADIDAVRADLARFATREDFARTETALRGEISALRVELREDLDFLGIRLEPLRAEAGALRASRPEEEAALRRRSRW